MIDYGKKPPAKPSAPKPLLSDAQKGAMVGQQLAVAPTPPAPSSAPPSATPPPSPNPALDESLASVMVPGFKSSTPPVFYPTQAPQQEVYAHPPGLPVPVPTREQIGLPPADNRTYDQKMEALYGPLPPPQKYAEDWRTPESRAAVGAFRSALLANFTASAAAGGNALSLFFQSNPYAYMLGQSYDMVEDQLQAIAAKNGGTDHIASQYMTTDNLLNTMELINGLRVERATGQWPKGHDKTFLTGEFKQRLDSMPARGRQALIASAFSLVQDDPTLINALANKNSAQASLINSEANRRQIALKEKEYLEVGRDQSRSTTDLQKAQADQVRANTDQIRAALPYIPMSEQARIDLAEAQTELQNAQAKSEPLRTLMEASKNRNAVLFQALSAAHVNTENAAAKYQQALTKVYELEQRQQTKTREYQDAIAARDAAQENYNQRLDIESKIADRNQEQVRLDDQRTYTITNFLPIAANINKYDYASVATNVMSNSSDTITRRLFFPTTPMKWSDDDLSFVPDTSIELDDQLPAEIVFSMYEKIRTNPALLKSVIAGNYMPIDKWIAENGTPKGYRHYVSQMNHIRQTNFLLQQYQKALSTHTDWDTYTRQNDISIEPVTPNMSPTPKVRSSRNRTK